ncbi:RNA polymerase sigma factor [Brevibacillus sp. NRS-1366]|uniref:RNA polymerase sigma factor n=1 Tax=Brevibacillus sp. NRS-1366 TaxID=3233899 RepID=UPI003D1F5A22
MNWQDREWVQNQMNRMYFYLVKNGANSEDAKDIVQETFYKAFLYADSIPSDKLSSWLFKVAIHAYYDLCRKQHKQISWIPDMDLISQDIMPEEALLSKESQQEIQDVLKQLSPTYKELLVMKYEKEMTYQDMGHSLQMKIDKVKTYLSRARNHFSKHYRRYNDHD